MTRLTIILTEAEARWLSTAVLAIRKPRPEPLERARQKLRDALDGHPGEGE